MNEKISEMDANNYFVKMACPILHSEHPVFFHPIEVDGEKRIYKSTFTGCVAGYHDCPECAACKEKAFQVLLDAQR